jgi:flagellar biosynthetic protein FliO
LGLSVLLKLVFIVALIYVSLALFRRWQGARLLTRQRQIAVVETVRLSPRQAIHLVRAGEQMLLIGATDAGLNLLADLELRPETAPAAVPAPAQPETSFAALLTAQTPAGPAA